MERVIAQTKSTVTIARPSYSKAITLSQIGGDGSPAPMHMPRESLGGQGNYTITFILAVPGRSSFLTEIDMAAFLKAGESLLSATDGIRAQLLAEDGTTQLGEMLFTVEKNIIVRVVCRITAKNFVEAEEAAYQTVMPMLSWWSFCFDVAIDVQGYQLVEEATGNTSARFNVVGQIKSFQLDTAMFKSTPQYRVVLAAYRDGMCATNVFYQCLCFFKVVEAVTAMRTRRMREARRAGNAAAHVKQQSVPSKVEQLASVDEFDRSVFAEMKLLGLAFENVVTKFKHVVRDAIAHLNPSTVTLVADDLKHIRQCETAVIVFKYMAREMLKDDLVSEVGYNGTALV